MSRKIPIRRAAHAQVRLDREVPQRSKLVLEYFRKGRLLAREARPLAAGASTLEIKTHPAATHVTCELEVADAPIPEATFEVECGAELRPVGRQFIVIGAMKAGTTTLFEMLARHPALCRTWVEVPGCSYTKEINYFRHLYRKYHTPVNYDWRFPYDPAQHSWTLDVSPNYAKLPRSRRVAARISALGGTTKLAYILRHPVDRIESQIAHALRKGVEVKNLKHCIRLSRYAYHLDHFTKYFPLDDILLLDFDVLCRNPRAAMQQVCDFLEIERFSTTSRAHNIRSVNFSLDPEQRASLEETLRPDVQRLASHYGFEAASNWFKKDRRNWLRLPPLRS